VVAPIIVYATLTIPINIVAESAFLLCKSARTSGVVGKMLDNVTRLLFIIMSGCEKTTGGNRLE
jgi:hypothetical protein